MSTHTTEPTVITAGDTVSWTKTLAQYPANDGWVLSYTLINAQQKISITSTASGVDYLLAKTAAETASWAAGNYDWQSKVAKSGEVYTVEQGKITINQSFESQTTYDNRSHAQYVLSAIESVLEGRATSATMEYEIAGRKMKHISHEELYSMRSKYKAEVMREQAADRIKNGLSDPRRVYVRFGP